MVDKAEVFLDLKMAEVVPVADVRRVNLVEERGNFALARNFFIGTAAFDSEPDIFRRGVLDNWSDCEYRTVRVGLSRVEVLRTSHHSVARQRGETS